MAAEREDMEPDALPAGAYRALVEAALDIIAVLDTEGRIRFVNGAVTRLLGYWPADIVGKPVQDFYHPFEDALEKATSIKRVKPNEYTVKGNTVAVISPEIGVWLVGQAWDVRQPLPRGGRGAGWVSYTRGGRSSRCLRWTSTATPACGTRSPGCPTASRTTAGAASPP